MLCWKNYQFVGNQHVLKAQLFLPMFSLPLKIIHLWTTNCLNKKQISVFAKGKKYWALFRSKITYITSFEFLGCKFVTVHIYYTWWIKVWNWNICAFTLYGKLFNYTHSSASTYCIHVYHHNTVNKISIILGHTSYQTLNVTNNIFECDIVMSILKQILSHFRAKNTNNTLAFRCSSSNRAFSAANISAFFFFNSFRSSFFPIKYFQ